MWLFSNVNVNVNANEVNEVYSGPITKRTWAHYSPLNTKLVIKQLHSVKSHVKTVRFQSSSEGCSLLNYS